MPRGVRADGPVRSREIPGAGKGLKPWGTYGQHTGKLHTYAVTDIFAELHTGELRHAVTREVHFTSREPATTIQTIPDNVGCTLLPFANLVSHPTVERLDQRVHGLRIGSQALPPVPAHQR